jgi:hypothetical protein
VPLELPKTEAAALQNQQEPITVSIKADGAVFIGEGEAPFAELAPRISSIAGDGYDKPIFVRADGKANYATVAQVMAALSNAGFAKINLLTDTGGLRRRAPCVRRKVVRCRTSFLLPTRRGRPASGASRLGPGRRDER